MTREEIIALAREADDWAEKHLQCTGEYHPDYHDVRDERFAAKAYAAGAATEREACAAIVEADKVREPKTPYQMQYNRGITAVAEKIRARGNHV